MATKDQERKALEQIRKIIAGLGEESYIGKAFEGCLEVAESNIEDDFWNSMRDQRDYYMAQSEMAEKNADKLKLDNRDLKIAIEKAKESASERETELLERINKLREDKFAAQREAAEARKDVTVNGECKPFAEVRFINHNGFRFVNVVEESGWTTSYKVDDLKELTIR